MPKDATTPLRPPAQVRRILRREMGVFFTKLRTPEADWQSVSDQVFVDALADALVDQSTANGKQPIAYLQTLVHELQDHINSKLKG